MSIGVFRNGLCAITLAISPFAAIATTLSALPMAAWSQQSISSISLGDSTVTLIGGGNQSINALGASARITIDDRLIVVEPHTITVDGDPFPVDPFTETVIDATGWGFTITVDDRVVFAVSAVDGLREAATAGDPVAQNNLAIRYSNGDGVALDPVRAAELYRAAADQGLAVAQSNYGHRLWNGLGVSQDRAEAVTWFRRAAENGNVIAMVALAEALFDGDGADRDPGQALRWFEQAAEGGNSDAMNYIGHIYASGIGVDEDAATAVDWFERAAEAGHAMATRNLGLHYLNGNGVDPDRDKARELFEAAITLGYEPARQDVANLDTTNPSGVTGSETRTDDAAEAPIYWYADDGERAGPISRRALRRLIDAGRVTDETLIWTEGMPDWMPAGQTDNLR